jgi:hypothetical protein
MALRRALLLLAIVPLAAIAAASRIALPSGDELWLEIPSTWNQKFEAPDSKTPPSVVLQQRQGATFNIFITPLTGTPIAAALADPNRLRAVVTSASRDALAQSVEMNIQVHELTGTDVHGFYFSATDKAPKPDEWKYLTQGMITINSTPFAFTILTNDGQESIVKTALELIRTASLHVLTKV